MIKLKWIELVYINVSTANYKEFLTRFTWRILFLDLEGRSMSLSRTTGDDSFENRDSTFNMDSTAYKPEFHLLK